MADILSAEEIKAQLALNTSPHLGGALSLDMNKYIDLENVTVTSSAPGKKGVSIWMVFAGVVLAILLFKH